MGMRPGAAIENKAMQVNPTLSNQLTQSLQDKYRHLTKLDMVTDGGDLMLRVHYQLAALHQRAKNRSEEVIKNRPIVSVYQR